MRSNAHQLKKQGDYLKRQGNFEKAIESYNQALTLEPENPLIWYGKGNALYKLKKYEEALKCHDKAISLNSHLDRPWYDKGNIFRDLGKYDDALLSYDQAISIDKQSAFAWFGKGSTYLRKKMYSQAMESFNQALDINPNLDKPWSGKGDIYAAQSNYQKAIECYDNALRIDPRNVVAKTNRAKARQQLSDSFSNVQSAIRTDIVSDFSDFPSSLLNILEPQQRLGKGGFARVFKAKRKDGNLVAVKIPISIDASTGKSFIAEMQNWTRLNHANIVRVFDYNIMPTPYFEMELCDGSLAELKKPVDVEEAAWIIFNVCEGLKYAHARSIAHRDLKPQNILLKGSVPKISDWGLSKVISESTSTTATSFTPYYAAPEQVNSKPKDERTDIWQIGVILYELVTGELPFKGDSMIEIGMGIVTKDPIHPGELKPDAKVIDAIVMKCLQKDPKNRYQSVLELQKDLAIFLRKNYAELLNTSVTAQDYNRSAYFCGDLVMINMSTGDLPTAYKYLLDLVHYSKGDVKIEAQELSEQIKMRMEMGVTEIPDELIQKAEIIVHQVSLEFRKRE